ncbi:hypothetical protein [Nocardia sp. NPDC005998]|uniref:hypothetical protein n=1 Tax=Nocardia sp. NPDC005998 TaxID=3156894 RepID=UPI0033B52EDA
MGIRHHHRRYGRGGGTPCATENTAVSGHGYRYSDIRLTRCIRLVGYRMSGLPSKYARQDWFDPEAFIAVVIGMVSISLPYTGLVLRDAIWFITGPPIVGGLLIAISAASLPLSDSTRRVGVGLLAAFAGFLLCIIGFLIGLAIGAIFT